MRFRPHHRKARPDGSRSQSHPYDLPDEIVYKDLNRAGRDLIKEINLHPWMDSTDYCSGHPPDRPVKESTPVSLQRAGSAELDARRWSFFTELEKLKQRSLDGKTPLDKCYEELRRLGEASRTKFCLNLNIYSRHRTMMALTVT